MFLSTAPQQQVIVQDSKILQHMSATGMVSRLYTLNVMLQQTVRAIVDLSNRAAQNLFITKTITYK